MTDKEQDRNAARRLAIIRHAREVTGNVALTCRYYGISRQVFYAWLRRYEAEGPAGLRDRSTDDHQRVQLDYAYPDAAAGLNRWLPLVKWLLAIPHYFVLFFPGDRRVLRGDRDLVRDFVHRPLSPWHLRLRRRRIPLAQPGCRLRARADHRPVSAIQAGAMTQHRRQPGQAAACRPRPSSSAAGADPRPRVV